MQPLVISLVNLYVNDMARSRAFYETLLQVKPFEAGPTFTIFMLSNGFKLGLWSHATLKPAAVGNPGACELDCLVDDVDAWYAAYRKNPVGTVLQEPTTMEFGRTCMIADPDGHRVRVYRLERR